MCVREREREGESMCVCVLENGEMGNEVRERENEKVWRKRKRREGGIQRRSDREREKA